MYCSEWMDWWGYSCNKCKEKIKKAWKCVPAQQGELK